MPAKLVPAKAGSRHPRDPRIPRRRMDSCFRTNDGRSVIILGGHIMGGPPNRPRFPRAGHDPTRSRGAILPDLQKRSLLPAAADVRPSRPPPSFGRLRQVTPRRRMPTIHASKWRVRGKPRHRGSGLPSAQSPCRAPGVIIGFLVALDCQPSEPCQRPIDICLVAAPSPHGVAQHIGNLQPPEAGDDRSLGNNAAHHGVRGLCSLVVEQPRDGH